MMTPTEPEALHDWIDDPPSRKSPAEYARPVRGLSLVTFSGTLVTWMLLMLVARSSIMGGFLASIIGAMLGAALTLVGMAWGSAIVFADSPRRGIWFSLFPPYMVLYTVQHWHWMRQPAVLFFCGLTLAFGAMYGAMWLGPLGQFAGE